MPTEFTMPKLGLTMEEGTIVEWLVPDGAEVDDGAAVLVVQTDKVETEVNVVGGGRLQHVAGAGATLACGEVVGLLLSPGEDASTRPATPEPVTGSAAQQPATAASAHPPSASGSRQFVSPNARRVATELGIDVTTVTGTGPAGRVVSEDVEAAAAAPRPIAVATAVANATPPTGDRTYVPATLAARTLADLLGVDLGDVAPDPREHRVTREGVAAHVRQLLARLSAQPAQSTAPVATQTPSSVVPIRGMRATIATRMHGSLREMAQLTLTMDADVDAVVADRNARQAEGTAPGYTDYVVAAVARALREHPHVNAQVTPDGIALLPGVHVGVAVALDGGLVVPVVRDADNLGVAEIAAITSRLAAAARAGTLRLEELEGGTFSVSALGTFGVDAFTPVINPPNVAILGVGRLRDELVMVDRAVTSVTRMTLSLTWDHRVIDGAPAAAFAQSVVAHLADPAALHAV